LADPALLLPPLVIAKISARAIYGCMMKQSTLFDKSGMMALAYCSGSARVRSAKGESSAIKRCTDFRDQFG
jgi:hypothetical protein